MWLRRLIVGKPSKQHVTVKRLKPRAPHPWTKVTILHTYRYVSPTDVLEKIDAMREVCMVDSFLDCMVEYNEVSKMTKAFAGVLDVSELEDVETFYDVFTALQDSADVFESSDTLD